MSQVESNCKLLRMNGKDGKKSCCFLFNFSIRDTEQLMRTCSNHTCVDYNTQWMKPIALCDLLPSSNMIQAGEVPSAPSSLFNANDCHLESSAFLMAAHCLINVKSRVKKTLDLCNSCFWPSQVWLLEVILTWDSIMSAWLSKSRRKAWSKQRCVCVCVWMSYSRSWKRQLFFFFFGKCCKANTNSHHPSKHYSSVCQNMCNKH